MPIRPGHFRQAKDGSLHWVDAHTVAAPKPRPKAAEYKAALKALLDAYASRRGESRPDELHSAVRRAMELIGELP